MTSELEIGLYIFILAGFLGYHLISRVPPLLHTPLMSATNAMSGISLVGSLVVAGGSTEFTPSTVLGFLAVTCSSTNVVGGFLITDRMLRMFHKDEPPERQKRRRRFNTLVVSSLAALFAGYLVLLLAFPGLRGQELTYFYIVSATLFILGLKGLSSPRGARLGMLLAGFGMLLAVVGTLFHPEIKTYLWIAPGMVIGSLIGGAMGWWIPMTAVPQRTALSHSLGALAATLIGVAEYFWPRPDLTGQVHEIGRILMIALGFEVVIGGLTFTGSLMAAGKLQGLLPGAPITYKAQNLSNLVLLATLVGLLVTFIVVVPQGSPWFYLLVALALLFGFLLVIPIGAADMPVVISLLNSYAGLADAAMGFVLANRIQIITGSLDGTSGFVLSLLMCRAMNRSAFNVLFGAFGKIQAGPEGEPSAVEAKGTIRSIAPDEVPMLMDGARSVIIVPGYGMAVAQAQHTVAELSQMLRKRGIDIKYAVHPVAGRMPGHMNVLLAEANVPYDQLYEMEQINPYFPQADLVLVVGANDVTNPAAKYNKSSPLYGMPILEVERAKAIIVLKRSLRPGFAGVDNDLYYHPNCMMLFGDARDSLTKLLTALKT
jgi:NAD(P) transhydrogenase subunit beta